MRISIAFGTICAVLLSYNIEFVRSLTCTDYTDETTCNNYGVCKWSSDSCFCGSDYAQDVVFVMDASGSVKATGWADTESFVTDLIDTAVTNSTRFGGVQFSSSSKTRTFYDFTDTQGYPTGHTAFRKSVTKLTWVKGSTYMKKAVKVAITTFKTSTLATANPRLMMLITDGNPYPASKQSPCDQKDALDALGVYTIIVGVGPNIDSSNVECLVDDMSTQYIDASNYANLGNIRSLTDTFLCPSNVQLQLTEVRIDEVSGGDDGGSVEFIEIYNSGDYIDLSTTGIVLSGFVTGTVTESTNNEWFTGKYLVVYNTDSSKITEAGNSYNCKDCSCLAGSGVGSDLLSCDDAIYIGCGSAEGCTWSTTMTNSAWSQSAQDSTDTSAGDKFSVANSGSEGFPDISDVYAGWTFELGTLTADSADGTQWVRSCTSYGTPGSPTINNCSAPCIQAQCRAGGDSSATCGSTYCDCTPADHYFRDGTSCTLLNPVKSCATTVMDRNSSDPNSKDMEQVAYVEPDMAATYDVYYEISYSENTNANSDYSYSNLFWFYDDKFVLGSVNDPTPTVIVVINDATASGGKVFSTSEDCIVSTESPTAATQPPTGTPTYAIPIIDACTGYVETGSNREIHAEWDAPTLTGSTPSEITDYYIWLEFNSVSDVIDSLQSESSTISSTIDARTLEYYLPLPYISASTWSTLHLYIAPAVYDAEMELMADEMLASRVECTFTSTQPTDAPSGSPTKRPTEEPSLAPTWRPTDAPTYSDYTIPTCLVTVEAGDSTVVADLDFTRSGGSGQTVSYKYQFESQTPVAMSSCDGTDDSQTCTGASATCACHDITVDIGSISNPVGQSTFKIWPVYKPCPTCDDNDDSGDGATCTVTTSSPTPAPTGEPTPAPTGEPTPSPTGEPTPAPTSEPTPAPTFTETSIPCSYVLGKFQCGDEACTSERIESFVVTFTEPSYPDDGILLPTFDNAQYQLQYGASEPYSTLTAAATDNAAVKTWSVSLSTGIYIEASQITDYVVKLTLEETDGRDVGPALECTMSSLDPTPAPTTPEPTPAPTFETPKIYFDLSDETLAALCTQKTEDDIPMCDVKESNSGESFPIKRSPAVFGFDLAYNWKVYCTSDCSNIASNATCDREGIADKDGNIANDGDFDKTSDSGSYLSADTSASFTVTVKKTQAGESDELFCLVLESCTVSGSSLYDCAPAEVAEMDDYPTRLKITISDQTSGKYTNTTLGDLPDWIWYPIAAGILLLGALAWWGYRYYKKRKLAEQMADIRQHELDDAQELDGFENFGGVGDDVQFNPLATAGTVDIAAESDYVQGELDAQKKQFEQANVDVNPEVFREDFGPVQAQRH